MAAEHVDHHSKTVEPQYTYPLQRYLKTKPSDFSKVDQSTMGEENIAKLEIIKNIVRSAEIEINNIASNLTKKREIKTVHLQDPAYFDKDFDQKRYIQDLVSANIQGMKIVEQDNPTTKIQKIMMLKRVLESVSEDKSDHFETKRSTKSSQGTDVESTIKFSKDVNFESHNTTARRDECLNMNVKRENQSKLKTNLKNEKVFVEIPTFDVQQSKSEVLSGKLSARNHRLVEIKSQVVEEIPSISGTTKTKLTVQVMPSVNIRSQLIEQKIPSLDIYPGDESNMQPEKANNVALVQSEHLDKKLSAKKVKIDLSQKKQVINNQENNMTSIRTDKKIIEVSEDKNIDDILNTFVSQESHKHNLIEETRHQDDLSKFDESSLQSFIFLNRSKSDTHFNSVPTTSLNRKVSKLKKYALPELQKIYNPKSNIRKSFPKRSASTSSYPQHSNRTSIIKKPQTFYSKICDVPILISNVDRHTSFMPKRSHSSVEYIPYSKLTVGGYNVNDIRKNYNENKDKRTMSTKFITKESGITDRRRAELDIDLNDNGPEINKEINEINLTDQDNSSEVQSSVKSDKMSNQSSDRKTSSGDEKSPNEYADDDFDEDSKSKDSQSKSKSENLAPKDNTKKNKPYMINTSQAEKSKPISLKLKKNIDVFDFIHHIETKDDSTQSGFETHLNFKETQTSPRAISEENKNEMKNSSLESPGLRLDIANLTLGDMMQIQKSLSSLNPTFFRKQSGEISSDNPGIPSCSKLYESKYNDEYNEALLKIHSSKVFNTNKSSKPENTQTSPLKTCHVMTSPTEMVNKILSPIFRDTKIDAETSPFDINISIIEGNSDELTHKDLVLPIPQSERLYSPKLLLSNLETASNVKNDDKNSGPENKLLNEKSTKSNLPNRTQILRDSTDVYTDISHSESSDTHSLGEINLKILRKKSFIIRRQAKGESNSNSLITSSSSDIQVDTTMYMRKSDGELSAGQILMEK